MAKHRVFVIAADVRDRHDDALRAHLAIFDLALSRVEEHEHRYSGPVLKLGALPMLHYASFTVFDRKTLAATKSKLVFECNIDGSEHTFLERLLDDPAVDDVYEHCEGYERSATKTEKLAYLKEHLRWPQLYHVGAAYRSAESIKSDRDLRRRLDGMLDTLMAPSLSNYRPGLPPGMREYWNWEIVKPWVAWLLGASVPGAALGFSYLAIRNLSMFAAAVITLVCVAAGVSAAVASRKMWVTALPALRSRVRPWLRWAAAALVLAAVAWPLSRRYPNWAIGFAAVFLLLLVLAARKAIRRRRNERLLEIRINTNSTSSVGEVWRAVKPDAPDIHDSRGRRDRRDSREWLTRLTNWMIWPLAYLAVLGFVQLLMPNRWWVVGGLTIVLFAKTLWLAVLLGWPATKQTNIKQDTARIVVFVLGVTAASVAVLAVLTELGIHPALLALIFLLAFFTLWSTPLPSPNVQPPKLKAPELANICAVEDRGPQNHMSAVVALNTDHRFRVPALKAFLWLLNRFYFRCLLPDIYHGKLFGITTVQFAQWVLLDKRNYLFLSNYDNSWTHYLDEFGLQLTTGIQKIWGQGAANPGTKDLGRFKDYARSTMVTHSLWYRAYPGLTLRQIWNNEEIRRGIAGAEEEEAMVRTSSAPRRGSQGLAGSPSREQQVAS